MAVSDYLFTPKDLWAFLKEIFMVNTRKGFFGLVLVVSTFFFLWMTSTLSFEYVFFILFLYAVFYWNWSSKIPHSLSLMAVLFIPFFLIASNSILPQGIAIAERLAIWSYYFLIIGIFKVTKDLTKNYLSSRSEVKTYQYKLVEKAKPYLVRRRTRRIV